LGDVRLAMEDVHLRRGDARLLRGVSWRVHAGEHWAVLGPNGSGKTTLVLTAMGYVPASRGRVFLVDGWLSEIVLPEARRKVGFVSAALSDVLPARHPRAGGLEVVLGGRHASVGLYERPRDEDVQRGHRLLEQTGAGRLADKAFTLMSTGERQICLVARCRMADSCLVIMDEPCAGLDIGARESVLGALEAACRDADQAPHVLITHHPGEIVPGISHVMLLKAGAAVAQGRREAVLTEGALSKTYGLPLEIIHRNGRVLVAPREAARRGPFVTGRPPG